MIVKNPMIVFGFFTLLKIQILDWVLAKQAPDESTQINYTNQF